MGERAHAILGRSPVSGAHRPSHPGSRRPASRHMKNSLLVITVLSLVTGNAAHALGVSPYLPLNLEPEIESQIERVLILGDKPVMTRPIAAATVLQALPKACTIDAELCRHVAGYLARFTHDNGITHASVELATATGADTTVPDRYGLPDRSSWEISAQAYVQPSDYILIGVGGEAYDGRENPTGTMLSVGFSWAQLDIGYRPHWLSPMSDSSMLISTEAPTMPSVTLSNYELLTRLGLQYEFFAARMSESEHIEFQGGYTTGNPRLAGAHLSMEPVSGWSFGVNRLMQYGGGARGRTGIRDLFDAFFNPSGYDNVASGTIDNQFGNQVASVTSSFLFPGRTPFAVYAEYAGEDTSRGRNYLLGNTALSVGIHFPRIWRNFDLTVEASEWQNAWYVHEIYQDGLTNKGLVIGSWFGDQRIFNDDVGGQSGMIRLGWQPPFGGLLQIRYRTLKNQTYGAYDYKRASDLTVDYSHPWRSYTLGAEINTGKDVFGASFSRLAGFLRFNDDGAGFGAALADRISGGYDPGGKSGDIFVDAGVSAYTVRTDLADEATRTTGPHKTAAHFALGARRAVTERGDLGTRVEFERLGGHSLIGVRLVDYRYRFNNPLALGFFLGAARYALATPAYGFYYGIGAQWRDVLPKWDLGLEYRYADSIARDHLLPSDPPNVGSRNDSFYDVMSTTLTVSRRF